MSSSNPQDEVGFVLDTIKSNWPGEWPTDEDGDPTLARINRDEPVILETGDRTRSLELEDWNAVGASLASRTTEPRGTEYDHYVETTISVRVEGLTSQSGEYGNIDSTAAFEMLVGQIRGAILTERSYPNVSPDAYDEQVHICYQDLRIENEDDLSHENRDYFRRDFDVRLTGVEELPEL